MDALRPAVLAIRRGGLGDTLLMTPVLRALRRHWRTRLAEVEVHFAGVSDFGAILQDRGVCERAFSSEALELFALGLDDQRGERVRLRLSGYVAVVGDEPNLASLGGDAYAFDPRPQQLDVALPLQIGRQLGLDIDCADAWLARPRAAVEGPVALAPGSGGAAKCWPRARWLELAHELANRGERLLVVVGPAEVERGDPRRWPWPAPVAFAKDLSGVALARELERCAAFVGNDSGTTHLAAMLAVPSVAIFGGGFPRVFAPLGPRVQLVECGGRVPPDASTDEVLLALAAVRASAN